MSYVEDRWFRPGDVAGGEPARVPTVRNGRGLRYRARWSDGPGAERNKSFRRKIDADMFLEKLETRGCLVLDCRRIAVTEDPVLLCGDHRDMLVSQSPCKCKNPGSGPPVVYFARMGSRVKIGWTTNVRRRMTAMSLPLSCVAVTIDGGPEKESALHRRFASSRIRGSEWFDITPELEHYIGEKKVIADAKAAAERKAAADAQLALLIEEQLAREAAEDEPAA